MEQGRNREQGTERERGRGSDNHAAITLPLDLTTVESRILVRDAFHKCLYLQGG